MSTPEEKDRTIERQAEAALNQALDAWERNAQESAGAQGGSAGSECDKIDRLRFLVCETCGGSGVIGTEHEDDPCPDCDGPP